MWDSSNWFQFINDFRYVLAVLLWMAFPPAFVFWISIHGLYPLWQKAGLKLTYSMNLIIVALLMVFIFLWKERVVTGDLGLNAICTVVAIVLWICCGFIEKQTRTHLSFKMLVGIPEVNPHHPESKLLQDGIYARIRNPRYVMVFLSLTGWSLYINYAGMYLLLLVVMAMIYIVVLLEERELRSRFGDEYMEYCKKVPRFIPALFGKK